MSGTKFSFSLASNGGPSKPSPPLSNLELLMAKTKAPSKPSKPLLFDDEEDEPRSAPPSLSGPSRTKPTSTTKPQIKQTALMSRAEKRAQEEALKVDQNVFDYDGVWDGMKAAERALEESKKKESEERKPKYIENFLQSAQTRRLDRLRAEEKMLQHEREKEGDEFEDKEKFVTEAYKRQMIEVRKAEEEEKAREEAIRKGKKGPGMTAFYKNLLDDDAEKHAAAVAASTSTSSAGPSLAIKPPSRPQYEPEAEYDPSLAREATSAPSQPSTTPSTDVEINDDGEVVNKRTLLKAGLNIMKKPKPLPTSLLTSQKSSSTSLDAPYKSRAVGSAASYTERMERERRRLAEQMKEEAEKKRAAAEAAEREEEERAKRRREGDDGEAEKRRAEAKERFLERKRAREEEQAAGKKKAKEV